MTQQDRINKRDLYLSKFDAIYKDCLRVQEDLSFNVETYIKNKNKQRHGKWVKFYSYNGPDKKFMFYGKSYGEECRYRKVGKNW